MDNQSTRREPPEGPQSESQDASAVPEIHADELSREVLDAFPLDDEEEPWPDENDFWVEID